MPVPIRKKKNENNWSVRRCACLKPKLDDALLKYLNDNEMEFSAWNAMLIRKELIKEGYYNQL